MPLPALIFVLVSTAVGIALMIYEIRANGTPRDLRGDWWSEFEQDLRDYVARVDQHRSEQPPRRQHHSQDR